MTNLTPDPPTVGAQGPKEPDSFPPAVPEEPYQQATESAQVRDAATIVPQAATTTADTAPQPDSEGAEDNEAPPAAGNPLSGEERPDVHPARAQQGTGAATGNIDIRVGHSSGQVIGQWFDAVQRHSGAELSKDWVHQQLKDYVPIGNEHQLADLLRGNHVLVLYADRPGTGRWTAALRLLSGALDARPTIRRIRRDSGDNFSMTGLRGWKDTGWILDLRDPDESLPAKTDFGHELLQTSDLHADGSYLVVLVSTQLWQQISHGATAFARKLEPPDSLHLFTTLLSASNVTRPEIWADRFAQEIEPLRPVQICEWAQTLTSSHEEFQRTQGRPPAPDVEDDVEQIEKTVRNAVSGWMEVLADWHKSPNRTSYDRNYLLLAAAYNGEPIDAVHRQVASLAQALGERGQQAEPLAGQQGPGLVQLARQINAELLSDGSLRFPGPGFAEAVVRYFWLDRPHLTNDFMKWTVQLSLELKHPRGSQLAERMAPWVLHHTQAINSMRLLRLVATEWSEDTNLAEHAHSLLVTASLDQQIGSRVRKAISAWANQDGATAALLKTLAHVFGTLTPAHEQMLGRLADLACSAKEGVPDAVGEAITDLWDNEKYHSSLRSTLISWFSSDQESLRRAAVSAFLHLAIQLDSAQRPILLRELQVGPSSWTSTGWRAVLEAREPGLVAYRAFTAWLDTLAMQGSFLDPIFTSLVSAVHDTPTDDLRGRRFLNLGRLGEHWVLQSNILDEQQRDKIRHELEHRTQLADPYRPILSDENGLPGA